MMILPVLMKALSDLRCTSGTRPLSKQFGEKLTESRRLFGRKALARRLGPRSQPGGGWNSPTRLRVLAELIVSGPLLRIREHGIGFIDSLHPGFGVRLFRDIGMVFTRQPAECLLDLFRRSLAGHAQGLVVVLKPKQFLLQKDRGARGALSDPERMGMAAR